MLVRTRLYYTFKPLIPYPVRLGVRRWFALRRRERVGDVWPINPGSEVTPVGWPGWPEGKKVEVKVFQEVPVEWLS